VKQVCLLCERVAADSNLFCQEIYCPTEKSPLILGQGDWLGDIEIVNVVSVTRTATLYEAVQQKQKIFLKVAHPGQEHKERLQREAEFFNNMQGNLRFGHLLPQLLPPYTNTTLKRDVIGKSMVGNHLLYFFLFAHVDAESLRDLLMKNPQLWIQHVGWITQQLATAVGFLHSRQFLHLGLRPECMLIRFDQENIPRLLLVDLGVAATLRDFRSEWVKQMVPPAYTAPELLDPNYTADMRTDVYGVGQVLYEMLIGESMYVHNLQSDATVIEAVQHNKRVRMNRMEDVPQVAQIALSATAGLTEWENRPKDLRIVGRQLQDLFDAVPEEKKSRLPRRRTIYTAALALLVIVALIVFALLSPFGV
jgi:serine/threonine protein kinase